MLARLAKRLFFSLVLVLLAVAVPWLLAEGVYSLARGAKAETSLAYALLSRWLWERAVPEADPYDASTRIVARAEQIEELIPLLEENGVGLGNSPYRRLRTGEAAVNTEEGGCLVQKPNQRKFMSFLRSNLFNPFDQMTYWHDRERTLPPALSDFFARYGFRRIEFTTNEYGERITLPVVRSQRKVLVAGDSVANGVLLDDAETIPSRLQAADAARQYVNLGVAGATSADIVYSLQRAAERYPGQIEWLVYVFCENDFSPGEAYGRPAELIAWLAEFRRRERVASVTLVYVPYIYNVAPEVTRVRGHSHHRFPTYGAEKRSLLAAAGAAGFAVVDFLALAEREAARAATQFAPLALYLDHTHLSPAGVGRLLPEILGAGGQAPAVGP